MSKVDQSNLNACLPLKEKYKAAIVGATGMVGQHLIGLLEEHPWIETTVLAASSQSKDKDYEKAVADRWCMNFPIPPGIKKMQVRDAQAVKEIANQVDIVFSAISASKDEVLALEHAFAQAGAFVTSCNSAYRLDPLVPMIIPAVNADHLLVIAKQRQVKGYGNGAIIVKSNCSIQGYVIPLTPLFDLGLERIQVHSEQAISGAGKTMASWPEMQNNLIPYIAGEEQKSEVEPLKIWGTVKENGIELLSKPAIRAKCVRVPVADGHTAYVHVTVKQKVSVDQILSRWQNYSVCQGLPTAPRHVIHYQSDVDRPQPRLDLMTENGMAVTVGQLEVDGNELWFTALSHNAILGAGGGAVLATELAIEKNLVFKRCLTPA